MLRRPTGESLRTLEQQQELAQAGLRALFKQVSRNRLAKLLGITRQAVGTWQKIPEERILQVERVTGIPRETLRPDLYRKQEH